MIRCLLVFALAVLPALSQAQPALNVGSKRFTESYILGEIMRHAAWQAGEAAVVHQRGLGNTGIVFAALKGGAVDVYPEYTGTIAFELLGLGGGSDNRTLNQMLAQHGLGIAVPLGFDNSYALAMLEERAAALGIRKISDLASHADIRFGLSQEFLHRKDGWHGLLKLYSLRAREPRTLDHGLAYEALAARQVDVVDAYSTDAKIIRYRLRVLEDDRGFFPRYDAVLLYRLDLPKRFPKSWKALQALQGTITAERMRELNAAVELDGRTFEEAARMYRDGRGGATRPAPAFRSFGELLFGADLARLTAEHLLLVFGSLVLSVLAGVPLGIWADRSPRAGRWIFAGCGLLQTVPALALLAFLIAFLGTIGTGPAVVALFLYALLPIVRNTASGLGDIPAPVREAALVLGLPGKSRLLDIELPLATRSILAGIKTSAVINVGTATIAAFVGAGGYGERIVAGLAVNDSALLLAGALPAAALALITQALFDLLERRVIPAGLRRNARAGSG